MKKLFLIVIISTFGLSGSFAQSLSRLSAGIDIGTGFQNGDWAPSVTYHQHLSSAKMPWLQVGWGLRGWGYYSAGPTNLEAPDGAGGYDRLRVARLSVNGASFMLGFNIRLSILDLGVNTDILGLAFGKRREGLYTIANPAAADDSLAEQYNRSLLGTAPTNLNALPSVLRANNGQSEVYARVRITERFGLKVGYIAGRVAYRTNVLLNNRKDRFASSYGMPYVALSLPLF
ncbi:hypothetical protein [Telluribacter sp.]|jgi:hypothetical protein|uniref:hypothetical protein n=1 Tax=Telluribacter sp. TaxID=1978767 RepID=UPI002E15F183|nr:hypothetical protein [Telluribacter sp.]